MKVSFTLLIFLLYTSCLLSQPVVKTGIDLLAEHDFSDIWGKRVILFTNSTGRYYDGTLTAELLAKSEYVNLVSIITPEHGFYASVPAGEKVENDRLFGIPVYSLYSDIRKPGSKILADGDIILVDIQDIGVRSYTYISTLFRIMQAAAENNKPVLVLDRPNPMGGNNVDGNILEKGMESFVGIIPVTYLHGLTIAELSFMINNEGWLSENTGKNLRCDLSIVKMTGYNRSMVWEDTGLMWFPTSPNVPTLNSARGLAMTGTFGELGFISIGIGTTLPFQLVGNNSIDWGIVCKDLDKSYFAGISISEQRFLPQTGMHAGKQVNGILLNFYPERENFKPYTAGIQLFQQIRKLKPELFDLNKVKENSKSMFQKVTGTKDLLNAFFSDVPDELINTISQRGIDEFRRMRQKYLLYD